MGAESFEIGSPSKSTHVGEVDLQLVHGLRRNVAVVTTLGSIFPSNKSIHETFDILPSDARVSSSSLPKSVCNVPEARSRILVDLLDNVLRCFCCHSVLPITVWPHVEERRLNQWSMFLVLEGYENAGIPIRAADSEVPRECLAKCHARARTEWQSLLSAHPRLTQGEIRNMLDDAIEEAEGRWQIMRLRNLHDINYVFEAQEAHGASFDRVGNF